MRELGRSLNLFLGKEAVIKNRILELLRNVTDIGIDVSRLSVNLS